MAPVVRRWSDFHFVSEYFDMESNDFLSTAFAIIDEDDFAYLGELDIPKLKITYEQFTMALVPLPDEDIYPKVLWTNGRLMIAPHDVGKSSDIYIKRPRLRRYNDLKEINGLSVLSTSMLEEARALQVISQHPHPGLIKFHGCRVRRGRITGLVLDRHPADMKAHLRQGGSIDNKAFMAALESAIRHLHSIGLAHNDINPQNVLVDSRGLPVLTDFGSCCEIGQKLKATRGTPGWIDEEDDYDTSEVRHDAFGLEKIRTWLDMRGWVTEAETEADT